MPIPKRFFPSYNRTHKHHGYLNTLHQTLGTSLELARVVWRSSWWLESRRSSIPSSSFFPVHLLRPARTTFLKPIKEHPVSKEGKTCPQSKALSLLCPGQAWTL
ncbi:hypothetical protein Taro_019245 [Colocasia esculenta]|uniref:Uncharacterized protein n=1 Tax=Colocasia esculenta TaxID=4460 RepID=A0A843UW65_COLES|nr:hypothetical protein [Colocasia esculenta]